MKARTFLFKLSAGIAPLVAALAMGSPVVVQAAASTIIVDDVVFATNCGKYTGKTAQTNAVTAITTAPSGGTVIICPGTYTLAGQIDIISKKLTIKRAVSGASSRPVLKIDPARVAGINVSNSPGVTIDGLVLDATTNSQSLYSGIKLLRSPATVKNSVLIGPTSVVSSGINADASGQPKVMNVSVTNSYILGYMGDGVLLQGPVKLSLKSSTLNASDGGRVDSLAAIGVYFHNPSGPTGSVTRNRIINNGYGIVMEDASKVSVTGNTLISYTINILLDANGSNADNNKVTGNTFLNISSSGYGLYINDGNASTVSIKKLTISKNTFLANQYTASGSGPTGIYVSANVPAPTMVNATISGNTFVGFPPARVIFNNGGNAGLKIKGNDATP